MFSLCELNNSNTGGVKCDVSRAVLTQPFIFSGEFSAANCVDANTFFAALLAANKKSKNDSGKIFPMASVEEMTDKSEANKEGTLGYGFKMVLVEGRPAYEAKFFADPIQLKALRSFNNKTVGILEFDSNDNFWGTITATTFKGFSAKIFVTGNKMGNSQNIEEGIVTVTISFLDPKEYFDRARYMPLGDNNISLLAGLVDVTPFQPIAHTTNVYKIGFELLTTQFGKSLNMYDKFPTVLWSASLFTAKTGSDFTTALAITSIAPDATNKCGTWTFGSVPYALLASGDLIKITPVSPTVLDAANVTDIEIAPFIITA